MDRNLALDILRATEAAALAASQWMGKGNANAADQAAIDAMHSVLSSVPFDARIVIGEGDSGFANELYSGEELGQDSGGATQPTDMAVDALECTRSVAFGRINALSVAVAAPRGDFYLPPSMYMEKIAVGADAAEAVDLKLSVEQNLHQLAEAKGYSVQDLTVVILDRDRHTSLIETVRRIGARIHLIPDGDIAAAIAAAIPGTGIDIVLGIGGTVAGVLAAAALRCVGGQLLARAAPTSADETEQIRRAGISDVSRIFRANDLVKGNNIMFAATGVTDGDMLNGVRYRADGATTHSLVMRSRTRTRRFIVTEHFFDGQPDYS